MYCFIQKNVKTLNTLILKPDLNKIKQNIDKLEEILSPVINYVGIPDKNLIINCVEKGLINKSDFKDAYKKIKKTKISVSVIDPDKTNIKTF